MEGGCGERDGAAESKLNDLIDFINLLKLTANCRER